jgi:hypothetical protein
MLLGRDTSLPRLLAPNLLTGGKGADLVIRRNVVLNIDDDGREGGGCDSDEVGGGVPVEGEAGQVQWGAREGSAGVLGVGAQRVEPLGISARNRARFHKEVLDRISTEK